MVRPHTKNELLMDDKKSIRMETNGNLTGRPRLRWLDDVCNDVKVITVKMGKNWH
jgi:hypothetical protein